MVGDSEKLRVLEDDGDWVKVAVDDDVEGYVSKEYVDCDTEFVEAESVEQAEARKAAVQEALDKATQMQEAAYAAMNAADGNEAAYAADQANAALAEAKMLASEQEYDYEIQDLTDQIAYVAQDTSLHLYGHRKLRQRRSVSQLRRQPGGSRGSGGSRSSGSG